MLADVHANLEALFAVMADIDAEAPGATIVHCGDVVGYGPQPNEVIDRWCRQIDEGEWQTLVTDLLINHYDPLYLRSMTRSYPTLDESPVVRPQSLSPEAITALAAELRQRSFSRT